MGFCSPDLHADTVQEEGQLVLLRASETHGCEPLWRVRQVGSRLWIHCVPCAGLSSCSHLPEFSCAHLQRITTAGRRLLASLRGGG